MPGVESLIELLRKISKTTAHVRIEVDYNGREFFWKVPQQNITASEWGPREGGTRESKALEGATERPIARDRSEQPQRPSTK